MPYKSMSRIGKASINSTIACARVFEAIFTLRVRGAGVFLCRFNEKSFMLSWHEHREKSGKIDDQESAGDEIGTIRNEHH